MYKYDVDLNSWSTVSSPSSGFSHSFKCISAKDFLYAFGEFNHVLNLLKYDVHKDLWKSFNICLRQDVYYGGPYSGELSPFGIVSLDSDKEKFMLFGGFINDGKTN